PEQEVEAAARERDDDDREPGAAQRVGHEGSRDGADRLLRAAEEAQVVLEVLRQPFERVGLPDGGEVGGDLLDRDVHAEAERERGTDLDRAERAQVDGDEVVRRHLVARLVRAEAALGRRRRDPPHDARGECEEDGEGPADPARRGAVRAAHHRPASRIRARVANCVHRPAPRSHGAGRGGRRAAGRQDRAPRSVTSATPAATSMSTTPMSDVVPTPLPNAACAESSRACAGAAGRVAATWVAPPSVSAAAAASAAGTPAGTTTFAWYEAVRMLPRTAVPSTAPTSYAVSEIADAAPAFSAGTDETMRSLETVSAAPTPSASTTNAPTSRPSVLCPAPAATTAYPAAENRSATATTCAGRTRCTTRTTASPATIMTSRPGSSATPACIGVRPRTSCTSWDTKNRNPTSENTDSRLTSTAPLNAPCVKSRTSSIGSGRRSWRRTNSAPATSPTTTLPTASVLTPDFARVLMPRTTGVIVAMTSAIDTTSTRPGAGSRDSGTKNGASASRSTSTGTAR